MAHKKISQQSNEKQPVQTEPGNSGGLAVVGDAEKIPPVDPQVFGHFIRTVFHAGLVASEPGDPAAGEHILIWRSDGTPGFPMSMEKAARRLNSSKGASAAWYYGTAVTRADTDGTLRNKKDLFSSLHVVVLDDVGTKVDPATLPEAFKNPSYIIESSPGNFQYGLVLAEPIEDYALASALIQLVYTSGFTDAGGRMPTKLVRLPFGLNGKPGEKHDFPVTLHSLTDRQYTPEEILTAIKADITWADVVDSPQRVDRNLKTSSIGAVAWQPMATALTTDGATDVILDWFEQNNFVQSYGNDWITVRCPWAHLHTTGDDKAGYSPLGFGEGRWRNFRTFKCFHEHCADRNAGELIHMLHETGQIDTLYPTYDPSWPLRKKLVFNAEQHGVLDLQAENPAATFVPVPTADLMYCQVAPSLDPKKPPVKLFSMYKASPEKLVIHGVRFTPGKEWPIYEHDGRLYLNSFKRPAFGTGEYDATDAEIFFDHIRFLCNGDEKDYQYVRNWVVCQLHDPQFRGNAILMTTRAFGVGRDTFATMLRGLLGEDNCTGATPYDLTCPYNDFLAKQLVVCSETQDPSLSGPSGYYNFFERLKDYIDPAPKPHTINPKFGKKYDLTVYASFLMFSNHDDAIRLVDTDRRIYVINNPTSPAAPEYYQRMRKAMKKPDFYQNIYRYVMAECEPDFNKANAPAPRNAAKVQMARAARTAADVGFEAMLDVLGTPLVAAPLLSDIIELAPRLADRMLQGKNPGQHATYFRKLARQFSHGDIPEEHSRIRVLGNRVRVRLRMSRVVGDWTEAKDVAENAYTKAMKDPDAFTAEVLERMEDIWAGG